MQRTVAPGVRDLLRNVLGEDVDELTARQLGRITGVLLGAARRELDQGNPDQMTLAPTDLRSAA